MGSILCKLSGFMRSPNSCLLSGGLKDWGGCAVIFRASWSPKRLLRLQHDPLLSKLSLSLYYQAVYPPKVAKILQCLALGGHSIWVTINLSQSLLHDDFLSPSLIRLFPPAPHSIVYWFFSWFTNQVENSKAILLIAECVVVGFSLMSSCRISRPWWRKTVTLIQNPPQPVALGTWYSGR